MADKKANKSNNTGSRKWLVFTGALVFIAIIVVIVVLLIPANTSSMIETVQEASKTSFLTEAREKDKYNDFINRIKNNSNTNYYAKETEDLIVLSETLADVLVYYNGYIVFAKDNHTLSQNYKNIKDNLNKAMEMQENMNIQLDEVAKLTDSSATYLQNSWIDFRGTYYKWLESYKIAINSLNDCYQNCFDQSITNNLASTLILNTISDYVNVITNDFKLVVSADTKGDLTGKNYNYSSTGKIDFFNNFVDVNINDILNKNEIKNFNFDKNIQVKYQKINKFFELYNETNFYQVINSINANSIHKVYEGVEDSEGIYDAVKSFI